MTENGFASDGFNEGDRVRLAKPFWGKLEPEVGTVLLRDWAAPERGEAPSYEAGSEGTILYPDDAGREFIRDMKASGNYLIAMDDGRKLYAGGPYPGVEGVAFERIPGRYQVVHRKGKVYMRARFNDGDRVMLKQSFVSERTGSRYEAGWEGSIWALAVTMAECWRTGYYPVSLLPDPFGSERGVVNVPAEVLKLVAEAEDM